MKGLCPLKIDLHVHTRFSRDSKTTLREVVLYAKMRKLDGVAITDHDTVEGAAALSQEDTGLIIIPGIEVSTSRGHILGLNVTTPIPKGLDPAETVEMIHEAGGIAVAAHPLAVYKKGLGARRSLSALRLDAVEVVNSSVFPFFLLTPLSRRLSLRLDLPQTGGSDAHIPEAIGLAYTIIYTDSNIEDIIDGIRRGLVLPQGRSMPFKLRLRKIRG
ncbi:MAG: metal-dependent phosphoesterase [Candidatus Bathyarchaeota archaeon B26-2]|nr:MAG: metal-dependent phosphoesterase [Candidatus Bathyarchaeota archaeon B26-2]